MLTCCVCAKSVSACLCLLCHPGSSQAPADVRVLVSVCLLNLDTLYSLWEMRRNMQQTCNTYLRSNNKHAKHLSKCENKLFKLGMNKRGVDAKKLSPQADDLVGNGLQIDSCPKKNPCIFLFDCKLLYLFFFF